VTAPPDLSRRSSADAMADGTMTVGRHTYGVEFVSLRHWGEPARLHIGAFCAIAPDCTVFLGGNHRADWVTTYPFTVLEPWKDHVDAPGHPATNGDVVIGNDVWIGSGVTIMSGVTVGDGAVLGANSTVASDVEPYAVVAGNPARTQRSRFPRDQVDGLLAIAWWDWSDERIRESLDLLCSPDVAAFVARHTPAT
jgi:acetyltransferase-like isoleucine patch superfamily enzyme